MPSAIPRSSKNFAYSREHRSAKSRALFILQANMILYSIRVLFI
jgi:hypothetical protein